MPLPNDRKTPPAPTSETLAPTESDATDMADEPEAVPQKPPPAPPPKTAKKPDAPSGIPAAAVVMGKIAEDKPTPAPENITNASQVFEALAKIDKSIPLTLDEIDLLRGSGTELSRRELAFVVFCEERLRGAENTDPFNMQANTTWRNSTGELLRFTLRDHANRAQIIKCAPHGKLVLPSVYDRVIPNLAPQLQKM